MSRFARILVNLPQRNVCRPLLLHSRLTLCRCMSSQAKPQENKWQLYSAVCLERPPVLSQERNEVEREFGALLDQIEFENSLLSDHELRHREDLKLAERRQQEDYGESETEAILMTALESEDQWEAELKNFKMASRTTAADQSGDLNTSDRQLDRKLVLVVKQKLGDQEHWVLPKTPRQRGESMRQAAERTLSSLCGDKIKASFLGNAPAGFLKYKYPQPTEDGSTGAKVFFFKAHYQGGEVTPSQSTSVSDFMWLTKQEMDKHLRPRYKHKLDKFIMEL